MDLFDAPISQHSYADSIDTAWLLPRKPYNKSTGASAKLCCLLRLRIVLIIGNPGILLFPFCSLARSSVAGTETVGNVRKHSARVLSLMSACNAKFVVSTAVRTMPLASRSLSRRLLLLCHSCCLVPCVVSLARDLSIAFLHFLQLH